MKILRRKMLAMIPVLLVGLSQLDVHAQTDPKEAKLRRTGSTFNLKIVELRAVRRNDLLTVQAGIYNESRTGAPVNYRFRWVDDAGMKVWDDEPWKPLNLFAGQTIDLTGVAPTPMATDFMIELNGSN